MTRTRNRDKQVGYQKTYYQRHSADMIQANKDRRHRLADFISKLKLAQGCQVCGYRTCAAALAYHHVSGEKEAAIANAVRNVWSEAHVLAEIEKCVVLCANCHLEQHHCQK